MPAFLNSIAGVVLLTVSKTLLKIHERHAFEAVAHGFKDDLPGFYGSTGLHMLAAVVFIDAFHRIDAILNRSKDFPDTDSVDLPAYAVSARAPSNAFDKIGTAQSNQDLVEIFGRNALSSGNFLSTDQRIISSMSKV